MKSSIAGSLAALLSLVQAQPWGPGGGGGGIDGGPYGGGPYGYGGSGWDGCAVSPRHPSEMSPATHQLLTTSTAEILPFIRLLHRGEQRLVGLVCDADSVCALLLHLDRLHGDANSVLPDHQRPVLAVLCVQQLLICLGLCKLLRLLWMGFRRRTRRLGCWMGWLS